MSHIKTLQSTGVLRELEVIPIVGASYARSADCSSCAAQSVACFFQPSRPFGYLSLAYVQPSGGSFSDQAFCDLEEGLQINFVEELYMGLEKPCLSNQIHQIISTGQNVARVC